MHFAETIVERAGADDDYRLQLQAHRPRKILRFKLVMQGSGHDWRLTFP